MCVVRSIVCLRMSYTYCMLHACSSHFGVGSTYGACRILIPGIGLPSVVARLRRCNGCAICSAACCAVVCDSVACANGCDNLDEQLDHFLRADARSCAERRQPCQQATEQTLPPCVSTHEPLSSRACAKTDAWARPSAVGRRLAPALAARLMERAALTADMQRELAQSCDTETNRSDAPNHAQRTTCRHATLHDAPSLARASMCMFASASSMATASARLFRVACSSAHLCFSLL